MFSSAKPLSKQTGSYQELIQTLSDAFSYDLDSPGLKLLEETTASVKVAIDKLTELEKYICDYKSAQSKTLDSIERCEQVEMSPNNFNVNIEDLEQNCSFKKDSVLRIYFSVNENVAEGHIVEAFQKEGFFNFHLNLLVNKVDFAYGFITFESEDTLLNVVSLSHKIRVGQSVLRIVPRCNKFRKVVKEKKRKGKKRGEKRKRKK